MVQTFDVSSDFNFEKVLNNNSKENYQWDDKVVEKIQRKDERNFEKEVVKSVTRTHKSKDEINDHQKLVLHLSRYGNSKRFSTYLRSLGFELQPSKLKGLSNSDLEELLERVQTSLNNKQCSNFWYEMSLGLIETGEKVVTCSRLGEKIKIHGLTEALKGNEDFEDLIELIELEYTSFATIRPELRLLYTVLTTALKLHGINSFLEKREKMIKEKVVDLPPTDEKKKEKLKESQQPLSFDDEKS